MVVSVFIVVALLRRVAVRAGREDSTLPLGSLFVYDLFMDDAISRTEKRGRGRPPNGAKSIHLTLVPDQLAALDEWIAAQRPQVSRPEAIRRILADGLGKAS